MDATTAIVPVDNEQNSYIELARAHVGENMLSIQDFVRVINYNIDPLFVDEQWNMLNSKRADELILLSPQMLERLKFCKISHVIRKLEQLFPSARDDNNEYLGDGVNVMIIFAVPIGAAKKGRGGHNAKQIKMTKGAYKELLMETQTDTARQVRKYYIALEELFVQYLLYQRAYELVQEQVEKNVLTNKNIEMSQQLGVVIKQNNEIIEQNKELKLLSEAQTEKLDMMSQILYNETNHKVVDVHTERKKQELVVLQNRNDPEQCEVLRGQRNHVNQQLKRKNNTMQVVGKIETYKNPINLYNRFVESGDTRFDVNYNKIVLKNGSTCDDLMTTFNTLNEDKHETAKKVRNAL